MLFQIKTKKSTHSEVAIALLILLFFIPFSISFGGNTHRDNTTCPNPLRKDKCNGPWAVTLSDKTDNAEEKPEVAKEKNKRKLADAINTEIKKYPGSKFLESGGRLDDPGKIFVDAGLANNINPILLVAIAAAKSEMASQGDAALKCGNPWGQSPIKDKPICSASSKDWHEYNKEHKYNETMINEQAKRIYQTYNSNIDWDPPMITLEDFIQRYNEKNPNDDVLAGDDIHIYKSVFKNILTEAKGTLDCGGGKGCNSINYSNPPYPLGQQEMQALESNIDFYKQIAQQADVPCEMIVALAYRENTFNINSSLINGGSYCNTVDSAGRGCPECQNGATRENDYMCAALHLKGKVSGLTAETTDQALIKDAFWGYNGRAYGSANESPYVANLWDGHTRMMIRGTCGNGSYCEALDTNLGTFPLYKWLIGEWPITSL